MVPLALGIPVSEAQVIDGCATTLILKAVGPLMMIVTPPEPGGGMTQIVIRLELGLSWISIQNLL